MTDVEFENFISINITKMQLSDLRRSKHFSIKDIREATGLSYQTISNIENNNTTGPTLNSLIKYLDFLGYELTFKPKTL